MQKTYFNGVDKVVSRETYSVGSRSVQSQLNKNWKLRLKTETIFPYILTTPKYHLAKLH